jgi:shikimate kinase
MDMIKPMVLVGLMGSGKTTLAKQLGSMLQVPSVDTDRWIEQREKRTVQDIVLQDGWDYFRLKEKEFCSSFDGFGPCIISTGGGFPVDEESFKWLINNTCGVYLRVSPETALHRILLDEEYKTAVRPLLSGLSLHEQREALQRMYQERRKIYEQFPYTVNADKPEETVLKELVKIASKT